MNEKEKEKEIEELIISLAMDLKEPLQQNAPTMTYQEAENIFCALGYDGDLITHEGNIFKAGFYIMLKQAQKINRLELRLGELEKLSHEHFDPSKFGPA
jgi:hypothetical protein